MQNAAAKRQHQIKQNDKPGYVIGQSSI